MTLPRHWGVNVVVNGETILTIESNHLCGVENIDEHQETIRNCARHLLSFIGDYAAVDGETGRQSDG